MKKFKNTTHIIWIACVAIMACISALLPRSGFAQANTNICSFSGSPPQSVSLMDLNNRRVKANDVRKSLNVVNSIPSAPTGYQLFRVTENSPNAISNANDILYTASPNFPDKEDFMYTVTYSDDNCAIGSCIEVSCSAGISVSIDPVIAINAVDDVVSITDGGEIIIRVLDNDSGDGDLTIFKVNDNNIEGSLVFDEKSITYTPRNELGDGFVDTFTYSIRDEANQIASARVTIQGPDTSCQAVADNLTVDVRRGSAILELIENDTGDNKTIAQINGSLRGTIERVNENTQIRYTPPTNQTRNFIERFSYLLDCDEKEFEIEKSRAKVERTSTAQVEISVTGYGSTDSTNGGDDSRSDPDQPLTVPTSSIGKIPSELPIARSVENLCDLLSFRNDPRTPGGLSSEQQDLRNCACAIVNEPNAGQQRTAIHQLSGGQHQFSDTVIRFAKANASLILRRMAELRNQVAHHWNPIARTIDPLPASTALARNWEADNRPTFIHDYPPVLHGFKDSHAGIDFDYDRNLSEENQRVITEKWPFDSMSINTSSVYFSATTDNNEIRPGGGYFDNRLGYFISITNGEGDGDDSEFEFDFDAYEITAGVDYIIPSTKRSWVFGMAASFGKVDTDTENSGGTESDSHGLSLYSSLFGPNGWFLDANLNYSRSDIDVNRIINFTASGKTVIQSSSGDTSGDEMSLNIGGGRAINLGFYALKSDLRLMYLDGSIDGLTETISTPDQPGSGLALQTGEFSIESFRAELGLQIARNIGTRFGVMTPYFSVQWIHEFEDRGTDIEARFVVDAYSEEFNQLFEDAPGGQNRPTIFVIPGSDEDSDYARLSLGSSFTFANGKTAWFSINTLAGIEDINSTHFSAGFRWEF